MVEKRVGVNKREKLNQMASSCFTDTTNNINSLIKQSPF